MPDVLVILSPRITPAERAGVERAVAVTQSISGRVLIGATPAIDVLAALPGVAQVLTGREPLSALPPLDDAAAALFARAWLAGREPQRRTGDGLSWDTPPMQPPDPPPDR